jgi:hypothetical protein
MSNTLDLTNLEKKAFRTVHQDGLLDICMGGIVMSMAAMTYNMVYSEASEGFPILWFSIFLFGMLASQLIFWAGKKFVTGPRLGQVKFGPQRKRRARTLAMVLAGIVLLQVLLVVGTNLLWKNPQWAASLGFTQAGPDYERLLVAVVGVLFVGPSVSLMAYFSDFGRGYYIAFIISLGVFLFIWFWNPAYMIAAGLLVVLPGVVLFVRFLREYPLPPAEVNHG